jgi:small-conductance mechanosensitive channel
MDSLRAFYNDHIVAFFNMAIVPLLGQIMLALLIVVVGRWLTKWLSSVLLRLMRRSRLDDTLTKFLHNISYWFLLIAVWLFAIQTVGVPIPSVLAWAWRSKILSPTLPLAS